MKLHGLLERTPLSAGARLLASGEYEYQCNGHAVPVFEPWVIFEEHGQRWVCSERIAAAGNVYIHVLASLDKAAQVLGFEISWFEWDSKALLVSAQYEQTKGLDVKVARQQYMLGDKREIQPLETTELVRLKGPNAVPLFFPLLRIFMGAVISGLLAEGGEGEVIIPSIVDPSNNDDILSPLLSQRRAIPLPLNDVSHANDQFSFEYVGDQYQVGSVFCFNRAGLLLDYRWQQSTEQLWQVRLLNFEGCDDVLGLDLSTLSSSGE